MVQIQIPIQVSSSPLAGASNVSDGFNRFSLQFKQPIHFPRLAKNLTIEVNQASIWWDVLNIITGVNDRFKGTLSGSPFDFVIPAGIYDTTNINSTIQRALKDAGIAPANAENLKFVEDFPTQKVVIELDVANSTIDFLDATNPTSFRELLGFNSQVLTTTGTINTFFADNEAQFGNQTAFFIHTDFVDTGIQTGAIPSQTIAQVPIDVKPGSLIQFSPFNPVRVECQSLAGDTRSDIRMWLTNQLNQDVNLNGENWSCLMVIRYDL